MFKVWVFAMWERVGLGLKDFGCGLELLSDGTQFTDYFPSAQPARKSSSREGSVHQITYLWLSGKEGKRRGNYYDAL